MTDCTSNLKKTSSMSTSLSTNIWRRSRFAAPKVLEKNGQHFPKLVRKHLEILKQVPPQILGKQPVLSKSWLQTGEKLSFFLSIFLCPFDFAMFGEQRKEMLPIFKYYVVCNPTSPNLLTDKEKEIKGVRLLSASAWKHLLSLAADHARDSLLFCVCVCVVCVCNLHKL